MDENHVVVEDLEFHDTNGGQHALWNISPPNSRWVSCSFDEVHGDVEIGVDEWTDGALVVENTIYFVHQLYYSPSSSTGGDFSPTHPTHGSTIIMLTLLHVSGVFLVAHSYCPSDLGITTKSIFFSCSGPC